VLDNSQIRPIIIIIIIIIIIGAERGFHTIFWIPVMHTTKLKTP
jgi:hypothetical protein